MSPVIGYQIYLNHITPDIDKNRRELPSIIAEYEDEGRLPINMILESQMDKYEDLEREMYDLKDEMKAIVEKEAMPISDFIGHSIESLLEKGIISESNLDVSLIYIKWLFDEMHLGEVQGFENDYLFLRSSKMPDQISADIKKYNDHKNGIQEAIDKLYPDDELTPNGYIASVSLHLAVYNAEHPEEITLSETEKILNRYVGEYFNGKTMKDLELTGEGAADATRRAQEVIYRLEHQVK